MLSFPNAKINLGLYITGKRPDGFHSLESIFYPVPLKEAVEFVESKEFCFGMEGPELTGSQEDNICVKAYRLLQKEYSLPPISIFLLKKIPAGAGLGGGSADASFMLKMLDEHFQLNLSGQKLEELSAQLGSDCPFFIKNKPCYVTGRGEFLEEIDLKLNGWHFSLIYPDLHISTKEAYQSMRPAPAPVNLKDLIQKPVDEWKGKLKNDFEEYAFKKYPVLATLKEGFYAAGAAYSAMTGSGSAIYALSEKPLDISRLKMGYFTWQGVLEV